MPRRRSGYRPGLPLAEAQARVPGLHVAPRSIRLPTPPRWSGWRLWALRRYSPVVALDPPDGLLIDVTGAAHLHGGEAALLRDLLVASAGGVHRRARRPWPTRSGPRMRWRALHRSR